MRKAPGVSSYLDYAKTLAKELKAYPLSLEVIADTVPEMARQAAILKELGDNIYVKIPVTNSKGETTAPLLEQLTDAGVKVNITALMATFSAVIETWRFSMKATCFCGSTPPASSIAWMRSAVAGTTGNPSVQPLV
jgi:transaldolase